jgi:hypothetical protein
MDQTARTNKYRRNLPRKTVTRCPSFIFWCKKRCNNFFSEEVEMKFQAPYQVLTHLQQETVTAQSWARDLKT